METILVIAQQLWTNHKRPERSSAVPIFPPGTEFYKARRLLMLRAVARITKTIAWKRITVFFIVALFVLWALYFIFRTSFIATDGRRYFTLFDDAMISMRYAWNASHGIGLVFNPGERVEGYTNLLMVGLMTLCTSFLDKSSAVLAIQLSGIPVLLGIATLSLLHWQELAKGNDVYDRDGFAVVAFFGALAYYPLVYWTLMGMETGLLTLLLMAGSLLSLTYMRTKKLSFMGSSALLFSLAYLARPDSAPVAVMILVWTSVFSRGAIKQRIRTMVFGLALYTIFPILQTGFRAIYYESLVPLTYILKATGMPLGFRIQNGVGFTLPFLREARWAYLLACVGVVLGFTRRKALLVLPPLILTAYQVAIGGDAWPYWRLVAPGMPYLILLMLAGVDWGLKVVPLAARTIITRVRAILNLEFSAFPGIPFPYLSLRVVMVISGFGLILLGLLADHIRLGYPGFGLAQLALVVAGGTLLSLVVFSARGAVLVAFSTTFLLLATINHRFIPEVFFHEVPYKWEANRNHVNVALSILQFTTDDASIGVIQAGIIPYYTSRYAVDFLGKNDPYIANLPINLQGGPAWYGMSSVPGHNKYDLEYSIHQRLPTYVESFGWSSQDLTYVYEAEYVEVSLPGPDPAFRRGDPTVRWDLIPPDKLLFP